MPALRGLIIEASRPNGRDGCEAKPAPLKAQKAKPEGVKILPMF